VVWSLLLTAGSEGPTLISCTASHLLSSVRSWHTVVCLSHDQTARSGPRKEGALAHLRRRSNPSGFTAAPKPVASRAYVRRHGWEQDRCGRLPVRRGVNPSKHRAHGLGRSLIQRDRGPIFSGTHLPAKPPSPKSSSQRTPRWRKRGSKRRSLSQNTPVFSLLCADQSLDDTGPVCQGVGTD